MKTVTDRILLGLVLVLGVSLAWVVSGTLNDGIIRVGDKAPDFKVVTETGRTITPEDFGGKLLVLEFLGLLVPALPPGSSFARSLQPAVRAGGRRGPGRERRQERKAL